jgi:hypothetical protein
MSGHAAHLQLIFDTSPPITCSGFSYDRFTAVITPSWSLRPYFAEFYRGGHRGHPKASTSAKVSASQSQTFFRIPCPGGSSASCRTGNEVSHGQGNGLPRHRRGRTFRRPERVGPAVLHAPSSRRVFYFVMNWAVSALFQKLEKKLSYYR